MHLRSSAICATLGDGSEAPGPPLHVGSVRTVQFAWCSAMSFGGIYRNTHIHMYTHVSTHNYN